jgi:hypothetical protein
MELINAFVFVIAVIHNTTRFPFAILKGVICTQLVSKFMCQGPPYVATPVFVPVLHFEIGMLRARKQCQVLITTCRSVLRNASDTHATTS